MEWISLKTEDQFQNILEKSFDTPQLIYKHSYACGLSSMIKQRLEKIPHLPVLNFTSWIFYGSEIYPIK